MLISADIYTHNQISLDFWCHFIGNMVFPVEVWVSNNKLYITVTLVRIIAFKSNLLQNNICIQVVINIFYPNLLHL